MEIKISLLKLRGFVFTLILLLLAGFLGYKIGLNKTSVAVTVTGKEKDLSLFWLVWDRLEEKFLERDKLNPEKMIEGAISGMVSSLGDPYTVFLPPEENQMAKEDLSGEFGGVGIQLGYKNKVLAVISPLKGTPADKAGVKSGDLILKIKDVKKNIDRSTEGLSLPEAVTIIRGEEGTSIFLTIFRDGQEKSKEIEIKREKIVVPSLESKWEERAGKRFAYIHLFQFSERMAQEWLEWVDEINQAEGETNFGGVVLDLRDNPGGYLQGAVFIAGEFLPGGKVVVWEEDYRGNKNKLTVDRGGDLLDVPLVVLINQGSASASEILAGALKDHRRAQLVGETTFGKGIVQEPGELPGKAGLHITIARWLLPNGDSIHEKGVKPDFEVKEEEAVEGEKDLVLEKGIEILLLK